MNSNINEKVIDEKRIVISIPFSMLGALIFDSDNAVGEDDLNTMIESLVNNTKFRQLCNEFSVNLTELLHSENVIECNDSTVLCIPEIFPTNDEDHQYVENVLASVFEDNIGDDTLVN